MALPRKPVHLKFDHDVHADLLTVSDAYEMLPAHWIERLVEAALAKEVHRARYIVRRASQRLSTAKSGSSGLSHLDDKPESD